MSGPRLQVGIAELEVGRSPVRLQAVALGSCLAVILYDPVAHAGGLAHVLLPSQHIGRPRPEQPARAMPTAVSALLEGMLALGADRARITARLVGGASMFAAIQPAGELQMGQRNIVAARETLRHHGLRLTGEAVGGDFGRTVELDVASGKVIVSSYQRGTFEL